ncbi:MAG: 30S ribosomal protein S3 [Candidatus Doudnabacteria bacterium]|nr:30S ribosomal protein S3 [Candidatus Doudnabacteria bacterium]
MGQKVNANSLRLKITDTWKSRWFSRKNFSEYLKQDSLMRNFLFSHLRKAGVVRVDIERFGNGINVTIKTTKPGMIIGKGGGGIEELKKKIAKQLNKKLDVKINIEEVRDINLQSQIVASNIADQLEKRISHRRAMKQAIDQVMDSGAEGIKVEVSGRIGGADIARSERLFKGKLPLHTLRANIDFARATAFTTYGTIGVKVWINKGEVFDEQKPKR